MRELSVNQWARDRVDRRISCLLGRVSRLNYREFRGWARKALYGWANCDV